MAQWKAETEDIGVKLGRAVARLRQKYVEYREFLKLVVLGILIHWGAYNRERKTGDIMKRRQLCHIAWFKHKHILTPVIYYEIIWAQLNFTFSFVYFRPVETLVECRKLHQAQHKLHRNTHTHSPDPDHLAPFSQPSVWFQIKLLLPLHNNPQAAAPLRFHSKLLSSLKCYMHCSICVFLNHLT